MAIVAGQFAQKYLNSAQSQIEQSMERLSSGKRINSAKDDPAGMAIASRMTAQINGMYQAIRNAQDGISFAQIADGGLEITEGMLQRIRVLAVQASNTTNHWDRQALQEEANQLLAEINRTAQTLSFNGQKILDGSCPTMTFQVGPNAGDTVSYFSSNMLTKNYGTYRLQQSTLSVGHASPITGGDLIISGSRGTSSYFVKNQASAKEVAKGINTLTAKTGVTASAHTDIHLQFILNTAYTFELTADNEKAMTISFTSGNSGNDADDLAAAVNAINAQTTKTGVRAQIDLENGGLHLTHDQGNNITIKNTSENGIISMSHYTSDQNPGAVTTLAKNQQGVGCGTLTYHSPYSFIVTDHSGLQSDGGSTASGSLQTVSSIDLTTFEGAQLAIHILDDAITLVNRERSKYGAMQSRFGYTINHLSITAENLSQARSRIEDTDYAQEVASLTRASILQQAVTAMIVQANQISQNMILMLIRSIQKH